MKILGGGMGLRKFLYTQKGGSEKTVGLGGGGGLRKFVHFQDQPLARRAAKISSLDFQYLHPPLCHSK